MDLKPNEELPKLKSVLSMAASKIDRWMGDEKLSILRENESQGQTLEDTKLALQVKAERLLALRRELTVLTNKIDTGFHEKEMISAELEHTRHSIIQEREVLATQDKTADEKLKELNRAIEWFRERLSLSFKKTSGNRLQIIFTNIDRKEPDCPFFFFLQVEDGKYLISGCEPVISDLDELVDKLNNTNNLRAFIVAVRKRFKKMV